MDSDKILHNFVTKDPKSWNLESQHYPCSLNFSPTNNQGFGFLFHRPNLHMLWAKRPSPFLEFETKEKRLGHAYQTRTPAKHKKPRTSFTKNQISLLESIFLEQKYLASSERVMLADRLNMSDAQVKTWFQNRRTKWRRQEAEEREQVSKTATKFINSLSNHLLSKN